jgi:hypothetical protein
MALANQNRTINQAALLVAGCFCLLGMAQLAQPPRSAGPDSPTAFAAPQLCLMRHTTREVSPRSPQPRAPYPVVLRAVVPVAQRYVLPRMTVFVPLWPIENWPAHRRIARDGADAPDPA